MFNPLRLLCCFNIHNFKLLQMNGKYNTFYCKWCDEKLVQKVNKKTSLGEKVRSSALDENEFSTRL